MEAQERSAFQLDNTHEEPVANSTDVNIPPSVLCATSIGASLSPAPDAILPPQTSAVAHGTSTSFVPLYQPQGLNSLIHSEPGRVSQETPQTPSPVPAPALDTAVPASQPLPSAAAGPSISASSPLKYAPPLINAPSPYSPPNPFSQQSSSPHVTIAPVSPAAAVLGAVYTPPAPSPTTITDSSTRRASTDGASLRPLSYQRTTSLTNSYNPLQHAATAPTSPAPFSPLNPAPSSSPSSTSVPHATDPAPTVVAAPAAVLPQPYNPSLRASVPVTAPLPAGIGHGGLLEGRTLSVRAPVPVVRSIPSAAPAPPPLPPPPRPVPHVLQVLKVSAAAAAASASCASAVSAGQASASGATAVAGVADQAAASAYSPNAVAAVSESTSDGFAAAAVDSAGNPSADAAEQLREKAAILHDLVGGKLDLATCRDVLSEMKMDMEAAAQTLLMLSGTNTGEGGGGGASGIPDAGSGSDAHFQGFAVLQDEAPCALGAAEAPYSESDGFACATSPGVAAATAQAMAQLGDGAGGWPAGDFTLAGATAAVADGPAAGDGLWFGNDFGIAAAAAAFPANGDPVAVTAGDRSAAGGAPLDTMALGIFAAGGSVAQASGAHANDAHPGVDGGTVAAEAFLGAPVIWSTGIEVVRERRDDFVQGCLEPENDNGEPESLMNKVEELQIYFPNMDTDTLLATLENVDGSVEEALQLLGEQYEEEYRRMEKEKQAKADEELARKLDQQCGTSPGCLAAASVMAQPSESVADDYVVNAAEELVPQIRATLLEEGRQSSSRQGSGLALLTHVFGGQVEQELLEEVLANQKGDVQAARSALRNMGWSEQRPSPPPSPPRAPPRQPHEAGGSTDAWAQPAATYWQHPGEGSEDGDELVSHRQHWEAPSGGSSVPGRRSGTMYASSGALLAGGGDLPSNVAVLGPGRVQNNKGTPGAAAAAAPARVAAMAAGGPPPGAAAAADAGPSNINGGHHLGPIRLLASIGIDFQDGSFSSEALEVIREAFNCSNVREAILAASTPEPADLDEARGEPRGSLNHVQKQALWEAHRKLPLALEDMKKKLEKGLKGLREEQGHGRLVLQLQEATRKLSAAIKAHHRAASTRIFSRINESLMQEWKTDLHALMPDEVHQKLDYELVRLCFIGRAFEWFIITGKGIHSRGDGPKLPAAVSTWLGARGLAPRPVPGGLLVRLEAETLQRLQDEGFVDYSLFPPGTGPGGTPGSALAGLASTGR